MPEREIETLASHARHTQFAPGQTVFRSGDFDTYVYVLVSGRLKLTTNNPAGDELLLVIIEPGDLVGEIAVIDNGPRCVTAISVRESCVLEIDRRYLLPIFENYPKTTLKLAKNLSAHCRASIFISENVGLNDAQTRLWRHLMLLAGRYAKPESNEESLRIKHGLSRQDLADSIGLTRVMVNRLLSVWRQLRLIDHGRGFINIPSPNSLEAFVSDGIMPA